MLRKIPNLRHLLIKNCYRIAPSGHPMQWGWWCSADAWPRCKTVLLLFLRSAIEFDVADEGNEVDDIPGTSHAVPHSLIMH